MNFVKLNAGEIHLSVHSHKEMRLIYFVIDVQYYTVESPTTAGKLVMKEDEDANRCATMLLAGLSFLEYKSFNNLRAMTELRWPRTVGGSLCTVSSAHSKWKAAVRADEVIDTSSSMLTLCSDAGWRSMFAINEGKTRCKKIGSRGGV